MIEMEIRLKSYKKVLFLVVLLSILFFAFGTPKFQTMKINSIDIAQFENALKEKALTSSEIDIKECTDFEWDLCYVFPPYHSSESVYEIVGREWTVANTYIGYLVFHDSENQTWSENQFLMVFTNNGDVVSSNIYTVGELPVFLRVKDYKFNAENSVFVVDKYGLNQK